MKIHRLLILALWLFLLLAEAYLSYIPQRFVHTRLGLIVCGSTAFAIGLFIFWRVKAIRYPAIAIAGLIAILFCLPGRAPDTGKLRDADVAALKEFEGVPYVWGGETGRGIDCSGLVRQGMIRADLREGVCTLNGRLLREAAWLWWNDCTAKEMRTGYRGRTTLLFRSVRINELDHTRLEQGDFAVTADGAHTLAYIGPNKWIEAVPEKVVILSEPDRSVYYFNIPVDILCWRQLGGEVPPEPVVAKEKRPIAMELQPPKDMEFKAAYDGSVQKYMLLLPVGFDASRPHDLMIGLHGHGATRQQYASDPRGECKGARDVAARHGMIFVSPDYRAPASWMGPAAEADMVQLIGELKRQYKVGKVYLVGGSMGGTAVLTFTTLHPELVDGVSSQNGLANLLEYKVDFVYVVGIQNAMKDSFGGRADETPEQFKKRDPDAYRKRSAEFHADKFTMPISFTVGQKDAIVPPQSVLRLAEAVKKHNQRVLVIDRPDEGHQTSYEDTVTAIEFVIKP